MKNCTLIILMLGLFSSCQIKCDKSNQNKVIKIDSTFQFTMKDATDSLDSKTGIFTRRYTFGHKSVYFGFTKDEIQRIEALYFKIRLDTLPDNYEPPCEVFTIPTFDKEFIINYKGKCKRFVYNSDYECQENETEAIVLNMRWLSNFINEILNKKEELNQLESSDIVFY